VWKHIAADCST